MDPESIQDGTEQGWNKVGTRFEFGTAATTFRNGYQQFRHVPKYASKISAAFEDPKAPFRNQTGSVPKFHGSGSEALFVPTRHQLPVKL